VILRDCWGYPVKWWQFWKISLPRTWEVRGDGHCYVCGKPASEPSQHWPSSMICAECRPRDREEAYAHHCETGE